VAPQKIIRNIVAMPWPLAATSSVAPQKIIRNIAETLEALVGMGCGETLRRGG
jgi:hypothetical protein